MTCRFVELDKPDDLGRRRLRCKVCGFTTAPCRAHPDRVHGPPCGGGAGWGDWFASLLAGLGVTKERISAIAGANCGCDTRQRSLNEVGWLAKQKFWPAPKVKEKPFKPRWGESVIVPEPEPLKLRPKSDKALVTVVSGCEADRMFDLVTGDYMQAYADRIGADFVKLTWSGHPKWPMSSKFAIADTLDFYQRIAYVDADVLLRPGCVNLFDLCSPWEFGILDEVKFHRRSPQHRREREYQEFRKAMGFKRINDLPAMFNCGVYVCPRSHKRLIERPTQPIPAGHCSEQDLINARILDYGLPVKLLPAIVNWQHWITYGCRNAPDDAILHFSGTKGPSRLKMMRAAAKQCPLPERLELPEPSDLDWEMDKRHVRVIHDVLMQGDLDRVCEVGCLRGYSTRALLDAVKAGKVREAHLCDISITTELQALVESYGLGNRVKLHERPSVEVLSNHFDAVILDGAHDLDTVSAEMRLMLANTPVIIAHDTNCTAAGIGGCEGPAYLLAKLREWGNWSIVGDREQREGELTHRGLMVAVRENANGAARQAAKLAFEKRCT